MATWTTPRDWVTDEVVTAAMMDTHIKDNLTFLYSPPHVEAARTTNVAIAANATYKISWQTEVVDDDDNGGMWAISPNPTRFVCRTAGVYLCYCRAMMTISGDSTQVWLRMYVNGALPTAVPGNKSEYNASVESPVSIAIPYTLAAGDYVEFEILSEGGTGSPLDYLDAAVGGLVWMRG